MPGGLRWSLDGEEELIDRLLGMDENAVMLGREAVGDCVDMIANTARERIASGPKTGIIYKKAGRVHQASSPSEYPASDTGDLLRSIWSEVEDRLARLDAAALSASLSLHEDFDTESNSIIGAAGADAAHAVPLEYKDTVNGGRPFLRRSAFENSENIKARFGELRGRIVDGGG